MKLLITLITLFTVIFPHNQQQNNQVNVNVNEATLNFPQSIQFTAEFENEQFIDQLKLVYGVNQKNCGEVQALAFPPFETGRKVNTTWEWDMSQSGSLPPGATIWWYWQLTDASGETFSTEKKEITWLDSTHNWLLLEASNIKIHYYLDDYYYSQELLNGVNNATSQLSSSIGLSSDQPMDLYVYSSNSDMQDALLNESSWIGGMAFPEHNIAVIGIAPDDMEWGKSAIAHEITHVLIGEKTFSCLGEMPNWLSEGIAGYGQGGLTSDEASIFQYQVSNNNLISFRVLSGTFTEDEYQVGLSYIQSYYMVEYLVNNYGNEKLNEIILAISEGSNIQDALQQTYGFSLDEFEKQWRLSLNLPETNPEYLASYNQTATIIATLLPLEGIAPVTLTPTPIPATKTPAPSLTATPKPLIPQVGTPIPMFRIIIYAIIAIWLLVILVLTGIYIFLNHRNNNILSILLVLVFLSIPFMTVQGSPIAQTDGTVTPTEIASTAEASLTPTRTPTPTCTPTPTSVPMLPTATSYIPQSFGSNVFFDPISGMFMVMPNQITYSTTEIGSSILATFSIDQDAVAGNLIVSKYDANTSIGDQTEEILNNEVTGMTDIQIVDNREIQLNGGVTGWHIVIDAYVQEYNATARMSITSIVHNQSVYALIFYSEQYTFSFYQGAIDSLINSIEFRQPLINGQPRNEVLILSGYDSNKSYDYDPATAYGAGDYLVFSGLVTYDKQGKLIPDLAESWDISLDGKTYTFHLRENAIFHNGRSMTARDVIYSWERAADQETGSTTVMDYLGDITGVDFVNSGTTYSISGVKALDDYTLQVKLNKPSKSFLYKLTFPAAFVVDKENVESGDDWYLTPNGTGPYRLIRWDRNKQKIYEIFDQFYGEKPQIKTIMVDLTSNYSFTKYELGQVDISGVDYYNIERLSDPQEALHDELRSISSLCVEYMSLDTHKPPFDDLKVRQAFALAIDTEKLNEIALYGAAIPAAGMFPPSLPGYNPNLSGWGFDPEKARILITESKYGSVENLPQITYSTSGYGSRLSVVESAVIQMWEQNLGIKIKVDQIEPGINPSEGMIDWDEQILDDGWCADYQDPENFANVLFHSNSDYNLLDYTNSDLDKLLDQAKAEWDTQTRIDLYQQVEKMIVDDVPAIFLYHSIDYVVVKPYVSGYNPSPIVSFPVFRYLSLDQDKMK